MSVNMMLSGHPLTSLFLEQSQKMDTALAVQYKKEQYTYAQLREKVLALATKIVSETTGVIGISCTRNMDMLVGVLAVLHCGKAYLPIDALYPVNRLIQIIKDAAITAAIYPPEEHELFNNQLGLQPVSQNNNADNPNSEFTSALSYVLFTSGTTGVPKGICMGKQALLNLIEWQNHESSCGKGSNTLQFSPLGFDVSFQEIFATLTTGGALFLIDEDQRLNPQELLQFITANQIHRLFLPFVALQLLAETAVAQQLFPTGLREVITAGEQLKITPQVRQFFTAVAGCRLYNQYGPSESHVVTQLLLAGEPGKWPDLPAIGKPIHNTLLLVLDDNQQIAADGAEGELCISGICLAEGYLNLPELTDEKFIGWQHPQLGQCRIYRTGDVARILPDGNIEFLGRKDDQVKIRGYRIELGEIEAALNNLPHVKQAVVVVNKDIPGQNRLIAYVISSEKNLPLRKQLAASLPEYMLPSGFVMVDEFSRSPNGKIDKKALPSPSLERPSLQVPYRKPATATEQQVVALWQEILLLQNIGADDNFFELGGNSLLAQKTVLLLQQRFGWRLPITKLYQLPTAAAIAAFLSGNLPQFALPANTAKAKQQKDIAIIGMACRFPGADTIEQFWDILCHGQESVHFFTPQELHPQEAAANLDESYVAARGIIKNVENFDATFFGLTPSMAELMDPQQRIFLEIAYEALESAGCLPTKYEGTVGVFAGCGVNTYYLNNVLSNKNKIEAVGQFQANTVSDKDYLATRVAYQLNLKGPAVSVFSACSTSLLAVAQAMESIRSGQCTVALAGGASITVPVASGHVYQEGAMLSKDGHTRSFDADATGTVFSDGAGVVVLKALEDAEQDGDQVFAVLKGAGINNDGGEKGSFTAPSAVGQATAIAMAIRDGNVNPADITYVEAHGTATPIGDPIEIEGLKMAFGQQVTNQYCAIGTVKSNIGHLTHAAGIAGLIKTTLAMRHSLLPASINYSKPNVALDLSQSPFYVNDQLNTWDADKKLAGVSSFGVGGTNVHVVLQNYLSPQKVAQQQSDWQLLTWSAHSEESATAFGKKLLDWLPGNQSVSLAEIAASLQTTRKDYAYKKTLVAKDVADLAELLQDDTLRQKQLPSKAGREIVFVFPGQGTHYAGMGSQLYQRFPVYKNALDECRQILQHHTGEDILSVLYPDDAYYNAENLQNTRYAQPALFSVSYALAKLWMSLGIQPQYFIGHSLGEFVAAHLAGIFSLKDALTLVAARAKMVSQLPGGSMLAVKITTEEIGPLLVDGISHALMNSPNSHVFSGETDSINRLAEKATGMGLAHAPINTSHAFHSPVMDAVVQPLKNLVLSISLQAPRITIISSVTGKYLKDSEALSADYWANHVRATVRFSDAVAFAVKDLNPIFVEGGPGNVLSSYIRQQDKTATCVESILAGKPETKQWLQGLGKLWQLGQQPVWKQLYNGTFSKLTNLPAYAFQRKKYWLEPLGIAHYPTNLPAVTTAPPVATNVNSAPTSGVAIQNRKTVLAQKLRQIVENTLGIQLQAAEDSHSFIELGVDSLLMTQLSLTLKKEFAVPITLRLLSENYDTISKLSAYLDEQLPPDRFAPAPVYTKPIAVTESPSPALEMIAQQLQLLTQQVQQLQHNGSPGPLAVTPQNSIAPTNGLTISAEEAVELKKPFGATARIERQATSIGDKQKAFIEQFAIDYNKKTAKSKAYTQKYRATMADPRVVSGFKPATKEMAYPIVVSQSKGSRLIDIDGNEYIDVLNGFGSNMLGYQPDVLKKAIQEQMEKGYEIGPQHELAGPVCDLICELTNFDRAALCNTGSEAVLGAIRIARTVTGRSLIVSFTGSYHGINDEVLVRGTKMLKSFPAAPGIMPEAVQNILVLDYGTDETLRIIEERAHEIAAVLVEPVQSRRPEFQPVAFLKKLRQLTAGSGTVLVFDEVITGFRTHPGGAQAIFDIQADLGTYGKVIGGGLPIGAIAGKTQFMDALDGGFWQFGDDSMPEAGVTYFAGTFVRHPLALAAAKASLEYMKQKGKALQDGLNASTSYLVKGLALVCEKMAVPIYPVYFGSLWKLKFEKEYLYSELIFSVMRYKGIHIWDSFPCFLTEAHSKADIDEIIKQFKESVTALTAAGLIPVDETKKAPAEENGAPIAGARLGLDKMGNPAWFIPDEKREGKFLLIEF